MRAVIFANGLLTAPELVRSRLKPDDLIIAADGGGLHCRALGIQPAVVIGDFDSLGADDLRYFASHNAQIIRFPPEKDFTDLELALQHACSSGSERILVFGALGLRWDQSLANLMLPALPDFAHVPMVLIDGAQEMTLVGRDKVLVISGQAGDTVSFIPITGEVTGVSTRGLEYPLEHETLYLGSSRSVSNVLLGSEATVEVEQGLLICVVIHHNLE